MRKETANPQTMPSNDKGRSTQISSYIFFNLPFFIYLLTHFILLFFVHFFVGQQCVNENPQISRNCDTNDINSSTRSKNQILNYIFSVIKIFLYLQRTFHF